MNEKMAAFKYIVQCYKCNCFLMKKQLFSERQTSKPLRKIEKQFNKQAKCTFWYPMFLDGKHSTKIAVLLLYDTMIIIWLNNVKH